jgi:hypothetical protein
MVDPTNPMPAVRNDGRIGTTVEGIGIGVMVEQRYLSAFRDIANSAEGKTHRLLSAEFLGRSAMTGPASFDAP